MGDKPRMLNDKYFELVKQVPIYTGVEPIMIANEQFSSDSRNPAEFCSSTI